MAPTERDVEADLRRWAERRRGRAVEAGEPEALVQRWGERRVQRRRRRVAMSATATVGVAAAAFFVAGGPEQPVDRVPNVATRSPGPEPDATGPEVTALESSASSTGSDAQPRRGVDVIDVTPAPGQRRRVSAPEFARGAPATFRVGEVVLTATAPFEVVAQGDAWFEIRATEGAVQLVASRVTIPVGARAQLRHDRLEWPPAGEAPPGVPAPPRGAAPSEVERPPREPAGPTAGRGPEDLRRPGRQATAAGAVDAPAPAAKARVPETPTGAPSSAAPEDLETLELDAFSALRAGDPALAAERFERAAERAPRGPRRGGIQFNRAKAILQAGRPAAAAKAFEASLRDLDPDSPLAAEARVRWAEAEIARGEVERAAEILRAVLRERPAAAAAQRAADLLESISTPANPPR